MKKTTEIHILTAKEKDAIVRRLFPNGYVTSGAALVGIRYLGYSVIDEALELFFCRNIAFLSVTYPTEEGRTKRLKMKIIDAALGLDGTYDGRQVYIFDDGTMAFVVENSKHDGFTISFHNPL